MEEVNQELANIQEIRDALVGMKGLTKRQRSEIAGWIACAITNGYRIAGQEKNEETLQLATWNLTGI
ncbi:hypothetical protein AGMMS50268_37080 [Spirochaetia bacterium]|nr:hypothetical protein AGMMS50268_37080 [Spirochaetia bacterium]